MDFEASHEKVLGFRVETFDPYVSQTFQVRAFRPEQDGDVDTFATIELIEVTRHPHIAEIEGGTDHRYREPFSLLFVGLDDDLLTGGIHEFAHKELGEFLISLNPVLVRSPGLLKSHPHGRFYESVIG